MKKIFILLVNVCVVQLLQAQELFYEPSIGWQIDIPAGLQKVEPLAWKEQQVKGLTAFSNAYETNITLADTERTARALVVYRKESDFLEALLLDKAQSEDERVEDLKFEAHLMEETFKRQVPGVQITQLSASETIGNVNFLKTSFTILLANGNSFYSHSYNGIVNGKELRVNIVFSDPQTGEQLLSAWRSSDFGITKQKI